MTDTNVHIFRNKAWYFLSIYYSRDNWAELLSQITQFRDQRQKQFSDCLVSFSEERGEHIRVAFVSSDCTRNYRKEITDFFQSYLDKNPSFSAKTIPYGRTLWCNYPNNTLVWDRFRILDYSDRYVCFHQKTFRLVVELLENDFSFDNILSCTLYLTAKGLFCFDPDMQNNVLSDALNEMPDCFENYNSFESLLQSLIDETDAREVCETVELYRKEDISDYSPGLTEWLVEVESIKESGFRYFCLAIRNILGLSELHSFLVLNLLDMWQKQGRKVI